MRPLWVLVPLLVIVVGAMTILVLSLLGSRSARFEVSPAGLRLRGDSYGRLIPVDVLVIGGAARVDLAASSELRPRRRTMGTGLPGYQAGWFRLANGDKALVYLTDRAKAVHIPTTAGYSLLLSPADPEGLLSALRSVGAER